MLYPLLAVLFPISIVINISYLKEGRKEEGKVHRLEHCWLVGREELSMGKVLINKILSVIGLVSGLV